MSPARRRIVVWVLAGIAALLYAADLTGLKPPPRILPSVVLAVAAVVVGVTPRRPAASDRAAAPAATAAPGSTAPPALAVAGLVLHALLFVPIMPIGLIAPGPGVLVIHGIWLAALVAAWRLRRSHPAVVLAIPFATAAVVAGAIWFGTAVLNWQP